jgi:pimeloyl-ACP methyl ester carboxylesterase
VPLLALASCTSGAWSRLVPEREVPGCAECLAAYEALPRARARVAIERPGGRVERIALERVGPGDRATTAVMIHGLFSNRRVWRYLARHLVDRPDGVDALLVDLPGSGESDAPDPDSIEESEYAPTALADAVLSALEAPDSPLPPRARIVLVGHSLGGAVILRALGEPSLRARHGALLARVDAAVLLAPAHPAMDQRDESLEEVATASTLRASAGSALGIVRDRVAQSVEREAMTWPPLREEAERVTHAFCATPTRRASQAMLRLAALRDRRGVFDRAESERLVAEIPTITMPTLIFWGDRDETLPPRFGPRLASELPHARLIAVPSGSHALPVEFARPASSAILSFLHAPSSERSYFGRGRTSSRSSAWRAMRAETP